MHLPNSTHLVCSTVSQGQPVMLPGSFQPPARHMPLTPYDSILDLSADPLDPLMQPPDTQHTFQHSSDVGAVLQAQSRPIMLPGSFQPPARHMPLTPYDGIADLAADPLDPLDPLMQPPDTQHTFQLRKHSSDVFHCLAGSAHHAVWQFPAACEAHAAHALRRHPRPGCRPPGSPHAAPRHAAHLPATTALI